MANVTTRSPGRRAAPEPPRKKTKRAALLQVRVSSEDLACWQQHARRDRMTLSQWVRGHLTAQTEQASIAKDRSAMIASRTMANRVVDNIHQQREHLPADLALTLLCDAMGIKLNLDDVIERQLRRGR